MKKRRTTCVSFYIIYIIHSSKIKKGRNTNEKNSQEEDFI